MLAAMSIAKRNEEATAWSEIRYAVFRDVGAGFEEIVLILASFRSNFSIFRCSAGRAGPENFI